MKASSWEGSNSKGPSNFVSKLPTCILGTPRATSHRRRLAAGSASPKGSASSPESCRRAKSTKVTTEYLEARRLVQRPPKYSPLSLSWIWRCGWGKDFFVWHMVATIWWGLAICQVAQLPNSKHQTCFSKTILGCFIPSRIAQMRKES